MKHNQSQTEFLQESVATAVNFSSRSFNYYYLYSACFDLTMEHIFDLALR